MSVILRPSIDEIKGFKVPLTKGELFVLNELITLFEESAFEQRQMEIYVQPNLFFGKPDFVVMEKKNSVWIIEVKDYLKKYYDVNTYDKNDVWTLHNRDTFIPSPFTQVSKYKKDLMSFADSSLEKLTKTFSNHDTEKNKYNKLFRTAVVFTNYSNGDMNALKKALNLKENYKNFNFNYVFNLSDISNNEFFEATYTKNYQLTDDQYDNLRAVLDPGEAGVNKSLPVFMDNQYIEAATSIPARRKIRGAAGSGKTTVLAKRVAACADRLKSGQKILVVTFNITMCNYIQDKIVAEGGKNLNRLGVTIANFHSLYNWKKDADAEENIIIADKTSDDVYDAIFIDEGQDFESEWFRLLIEDYLNKSDEETNEYVIFADEAQNIYSRFQEEVNIDGGHRTLPVTPVPGKWRNLTKNFRMENDHITQVSKEFAQTFLSHNIDTENQSDNHRQLNLMEEVSESPIYYTKAASNETIATYVRNSVNYLIQEKQAKINDIAILSGSTALLRNIEDRLNKENISNNIFIKTATTFVPQREIQKDLDAEYDKSYKMQFFRNLGPLKFSTIHSFKGWETKHIILIIQSSDQQEKANESLDDITYVGMTRAKDDLLIIDSSGRYENFFSNQSDHVTVIH